MLFKFILSDTHSSYFPKISKSLYLFFYENSINLLYFSLKTISVFFSFERKIDTYHWNFWCILFSTKLDSFNYFKSKIFFSFPCLKLKSSCVSVPFAFLEELLEDRLGLLYNAVSLLKTNRKNKKSHKILKAG